MQEQKQPNFKEQKLDSVLGLESQSSFPEVTIVLTPAPGPCPVPNDPLVVKGSSRKCIRNASLFPSHNTYPNNVMRMVPVPRRNMFWQTASIVIAMAVILLAISLAVRVASVIETLTIAKQTFNVGMAEGVTAGRPQGIRYATSKMASGDEGPVRLPDIIPWSANVFDVRQTNPFWGNIYESIQDRTTTILKPHRKSSLAVIGEQLGYHFGWARGFKFGFCSVQGTDCGEERPQQSPCPVKTLLGITLPC